MIYIGIFMEMNRRKFLASTAAGSSILVAGCLTGSEYGKGHEVPDGPVANAPIPENPGEMTYATMGPSSASVPVFYFGNFKCPFCKEFSTQILPKLVEDYVVPGDIQIQSRSLVYVNGSPFLGADSPRLGQAGLAVWNNDPEQYWTFHEYVYQNQPAESQNWGTVSNILNFAEGSNVENLDQIETEVKDQAYSSELEETAQTASGLGISGTPTLWIDGTTVNGLEEQQVRNAIEDAL